MLAGLPPAAPGLAHGAEKRTDCGSKLPCERELLWSLSVFWSPEGCRKQRRVEEAVVFVWAQMKGGCVSIPACFPAGGNAWCRRSPFPGGVFRGCIFPGDLAART